MTRNGHGGPDTRSPDRDGWWQGHIYRQQPELPAYGGRADPSDGEESTASHGRRGGLGTRRGGRLEEADHRVAKAAWEAFRQALRLVELTPQLEADAGDLAERHALSGFDAIHLASALTLTGLPLLVATWDVRLLRAARSAGLDSLPAQR